MLPPLDTGVLNALVTDGDDAGSWMISQAKDCLNMDRNLSLGVLMLLSPYGPFSAQPYQAKAPLDSNKEGADSWHIGFRVRLPKGKVASLTNDRSAQNPPFDDLSIYSTSIEGVIDIHVLKKPFISFSMFDKPRNWQAMLHWLWEHGDNRQIARSIPQLDPQTLRALVDEKDSEMESGQMNIDGLTDIQVQNEELSIRSARKALAKGDIGEGIYEMLLAFQIFEPSLHQGKPSHLHTGVGLQKWHISFRVRNLVPFLAARNAAEHLLRSPHFAASVSSPVRMRLWLISMHSTSSSNHCR